MITVKNPEMNESSKFNIHTSNDKLAAEVKRLVKKAKSSNDSNDAWAVVDFLHDFPNALCESVMNESSYRKPKLTEDVLAILDKNKISYKVGKTGLRVEVSKKDLEKASELARTVDKDSEITICSRI